MKGLPHVSQVKHKRGNTRNGQDNKYATPDSAFCDTRYGTRQRQDKCPSVMPTDDCSQNRAMVYARTYYVIDLICSNSNITCHEQAFEIKMTDDHQQKSD